jgi:hypothetical protein
MRRQLDFPSPLSSFDGIFRFGLGDAFARFSPFHGFITRR